MPTIWDSANLLCYNAIDGGCLGNGTTDDSAALQATINTASANANGATVILTATANSYRLSNNVTVPANVAMVVFSGAQIALDAGKTLTCNGPFSAVRELIFVGLGTMVFAPKSVDSIYPEWWGTNTSPGTTDMSAAIQAALTCSSTCKAPVLLTGETYNIASTGLTLYGAASLVGVGVASTITYAGSGSALTVSYAAFSRYAGLNIVASHNSANGLELGNSTRQCELDELYLQGNGSASATGAAIYLNAGTSGAFSGGLAASCCYGIGFKFGIKVDGPDLVTNTWTIADFTDCWLVGRGAAYVTGGAGIYMSATANCGGFMFRGGLMEAWDTAVFHLNGGTGGYVQSAIEGYNTLYTVGASFTGKIEVTHGGARYDKISSGLVPASFQSRWLSGTGPITESYYSPSTVVYDTSSQQAEAAWYRGASLIAGGSPTKHAAFGLGVVAGDFTPQSTYLYLAGHKMAWHTAAPTGGTWAQGDIVWNTGTTAGGSPGWVCTAAGTPGTWHTMANLI